MDTIKKVLHPLELEREWNENSTASTWLFDYLRELIRRIEEETGVSAMGDELIRLRDLQCGDVYQYNPDKKDTLKIYEYGHLAFVRYNIELDCLALGYRVLISPKDAGITDLRVFDCMIKSDIIGTAAYYIPANFFTDYDRAAAEIKRIYRILSGAVIW